MNNEISADPLHVQASRGFQATLLSQGVRVLCKAISVVTVARLVTPADHGLFAMAASVFYLVVLFRDFGLGAAALQSRELTEEQRTTLWHAHAVLGLVLAVVALCLGPAAAAFYREPRVFGVLAAMSAGLVIIGLNSWPRVQLTRELRFSELNQLETLAAVTGTIAMIAAAAMGAGAYAFVVFLLVSEIVALREAWRRSAWRPSARGRWSSLGGLWRSGSDLTGYNVLLATLAQIDTLLMGRWFGAAPLGLYSRPNQVLSLPMQHVGAPLTQVMLATLARRESDSPEFARHVRVTANLIAHLTLPLATWCAAMPNETVHLLFGSAWLPAAPFLRWLAIAAATSYLGATVYGLSVATHHTRRLAAMTAIVVIATVTGLWLGRAHGPEGLAVALAWVNLVLLLPRLWWATRDTPVQLRDYLRAFVGPITVSAAFAGGLIAGRFLAGESELPVRLAVAAICGVASGGACALATPVTREEFKQLWRHLPFARSATQSRPEDHKPETRAGISSSDQSRP